jgi:hypothetical protein
MYGQTKAFIEIIKKSIKELGGSLDDAARIRMFKTNIKR